MEIEKWANLEEHVEAKGESNRLVWKCKVYLWKLRFYGINFSDFCDFLQNSS